MRLSLATNLDSALIETVKGFPVYGFFGKLPVDPVGGGRTSSRRRGLQEGRSDTGCFTPRAERCSTGQEIW
jgi:hypothetical protein